MIFLASIIPYDTDIAHTIPGHVYISFMFAPDIDVMLSVCALVLDTSALSVIRHVVYVV